MTHFICVTCGTQFAASDGAPIRCPICEDERQYIGQGGQQWTTLAAMSPMYHNEIKPVESNLTGIGTFPQFAIGQRALLAQTPAGMGYTQRAPVAEGDLLWRSDRDGVLGSGGQLSVADLSVGQHEISLSAPSGSGTISATVAITVYADAQGLPVQADALILGPDFLAFDPGAGVTSTLLYVGNLNFTRPLTWTAQVDQPWVILASATGITPQAIGVSVDPSGLAVGEHTAVISVSSPELTSAPATIQVRLIIEGDGPGAYTLFVPMLLR